MLGGFLVLVAGIPAVQDPRPALAGGPAARSYFDFRRDLPAEATLRRLSADFFADTARTRIAHEPLHFRSGPGLEPAHGIEGERSECWPATVVERLQAARRAVLASFVPEVGGEPGQQKGAWQAALSDGRGLFVVELTTGATSPSTHVFTVYDATTGRAAPALERTSRWLACAQGEPPPVTECDLDGDGCMEIAFPQCDHNGTVINTHLRHYFAIDPKPELQPLLELQHDQWISVVSDGDAGFVRRALHRSSRGGLRVLVWYENACFGTLRVPIGALGISRLPSGGYRDEEHELVLPGAEDYLHR